MNKSFRIGRLSPVWLAAVWSIVLFAGFVSIVPQPSTVIGYVWKGEFALALLIFSTILFAMRVPKKEFVTIRFSADEVYFIILPLASFTVWSGLSCFWAASERSALHHTLLWSCYLLFYVLMRAVVAQPKLLRFSFKVTASCLAILTAACLIEYAATAKEVLFNFTYRYYKFAEIFAALLPVFAALALRAKSRGAKLFAALAVALWAGVFVSLSRTILIAGVVGIFVFCVSAFFLADWKPYLKKSVVLLILFAATVAVVVCIPHLAASERGATIIARFGDGNKYNQASYESRYLFWGVALESFKEKPLAGVGADNYAAAYRAARESYSSRDKENPLLEINENVLPERAHNEFLQILAELGAVGAILFAWFLAGVLKFAVSMRGKPQSLVSVGALAGIAAFLVSSLASSYSFRVAANGACFFFLLALFVGGASKTASSADASKTAKFDFRFKPSFAAINLILCAAMMMFSAVRAASLMYLQTASSAADAAQAEADFQTAAALDARDPLIKYFNASRLYNLRRPQEAIPQMRFAIDNGIATSVAYFYLAAAQIAAKQPDEAEQTLREALRVYPRSVFLLVFHQEFLRGNEREAEAEIEYEKAVGINAAQAFGWRTVQAEGTAKLNFLCGTDENKYVQVMNLEPTNAVYAVLDFQRQNNPNLVAR